MLAYIHRNEPLKHTIKWLAPVLVAYAGALPTDPLAQLIGAIGALVTFATIAGATTADLIKAAQKVLSLACAYFAPAALASRPEFGALLSAISLGLIQSTATSFGTAAKIDAAVRASLPPAPPK